MEIAYLKPFVGKHFPKQNADKRTPSNQDGLCVFLPVLTIRFGIPYMLALMGVILCNNCFAIFYFREWRDTQWRRGMLQRRPTRRILRDVVILVPFFIISFFKNPQKTSKTKSILFPPGREL